MEATLSGEAYAKVDDGDAATQARTTLVQRARHSGQVGWGTITAKLSQSITPDVDSATAAGLAASLLERPTAGARELLSADVLRDLRALAARGEAGAGGAEAPQGSASKL